MGAVTLLPRYDRDNGWFETLPERPPTAPLSGRVDADVVVVGAGFTGLAAARRLGELRPDASIVLLEAGLVGNNAAGRSSGFAIDHAHNLRAMGFGDTAEHERRQIGLNRAGQEYLGSAVAAHGIDCGWKWAGKTHAACTAKGIRHLEHFANSLDRIDEPYEVFDEEATVDRLGIDFYRRSLHTPGTVPMPPAASIGGDRSWGVIPADPSGTTVRRLDDGRILVRNVYSYSRRSRIDGRARERAGRAHRRSFERRFPGLAQVPFEYTWGGALSMARNGQPLFGRLGDGLLGALVHNGTGISRGTICGRLVAEMACDEGSDLLDTMLAMGRPNRNLPAPVLGWGVRMYARRLQLQAGREM